MAILYLSSYSQSTVTTIDTFLVGEGRDKVFQVVEHMPEFPGGEAGLMNFVQKNVNYPDYERENDIQGRVIVGFIVNEDGSVSDVSVKKGVSPGLDAEAMRVVRLMPKFKPGTQQGKVVRVQFVMPLMFKLAAENAPALSDLLPHAMPFPPPPHSNISVPDYPKSATLPAFPGGNQALADLITSRNKYKKIPGKQSQVQLMITIDESGNAISPNIISGLSEKYNQEALRIVRKLPKFIPATRDGKPDKWFYLIPVSFPAN